MLVYLSSATSWKENEGQVNVEKILSFVFEKNQCGTPQGCVLVHFEDLVPIAL